MISREIKRSSTSLACTPGQLPDSLPVASQVRNVHLVHKGQQGKWKEYHGVMMAASQGTELTLTTDGEDERRYGSTPMS